MSAITVEFRFALGVSVYFKHAAHDRACRPNQFVVVERIAQECAGGLQKLYRFSGDTNTYSEIALTVEEPPYRPMTKAHLQERLRIISAERQATWRDMQPEAKPEGEQ